MAWALTPVLKTTAFMGTRAKTPATIALKASALFVAIKTTALFIALKTTA